MNLSDDDIILLFYLQKYTYLTIKQAVKSINNKRSYQVVARKLREMASVGYVSNFGGHKVGFTNVPKIYFIKKKGYEILIDHDLPIELIGKFKEKSKPSWTNQTKHRINLIDMFLSLECEVRQNKKLDLVKIFLEYNRVKKGNRTRTETTDFISKAETPENKIVPDGAFILRSLKTENRVLFFVEMDMGTEGIISKISNNINLPLYERIKKYDKYLTGGNYAKKYREWGNFDYFILLFITKSEQRIENIRKKLFDLPPEYHEYYMFNTYDVVKDNFFNNQWKSRSITDDRGQSLLS